MPHRYGRFQPLVPFLGHVPPPGTVVVYPSWMTPTGAPTVRMWNGRFIDTSGTTTSGIQEAIDALRSGGNGGRVLLCEGDYEITTQLSLTGGDLILEGVGPSTVVTNSATSSPYTLIDNTGSGRYFVRNLRVKVGSNLTDIFEDDGYRPLNLLAYGADPTGTNDSSAAVQRWINDGRELGRQMYAPKGTYLIQSQVTEYTGSVADADLPRNVIIKGDGRDATVFLDGLSSGSGPFWKFEAYSGGLPLEVEISNLQFRGSALRPSDHLTYFQTRAAIGTFSMVKWDGVNNRYRSLAFFEDCFNIEFRQAYVKNNNGTGFEVSATTKNSGNFHFVGGEFAFVHCGVFTYGAFTQNSMNFFGTKFVGRAGSSGLPDHLQIAPGSNWTVGSTTLSFPTGLNLAAGDFLFFAGTSTDQEVAEVSSYSSSTGTLVLQAGLKKDYWKSGAGLNVEVFAGGAVGVATGQLSPCMNFYGAHVEACGLIFVQAPVTILKGVIFGSGVLSNALAAGQEHFIFWTGDNAFCLEVSSFYYDPSRSDNKLIKVIDGAGGNIPGHLTVGTGVLTPGTGTASNVVTNANNARLVEIESKNTETITFRTDTNLYRSSANVLKTDDEFHAGGAIAPQATAAKIYSGSGSPEGSVTAAVGSIYLRTDGGAGTSIYVKESGTGNTGWAAK